MATYTDQLASVRAAMAKIEAKGQRWEMGDGSNMRRVERADYAALAAREKYLKPLADAEAAGRTGRRMRTMSTGL